MTREELKEHCKRQIQQFERVEKIMPVTLNDWKRYEEHKMVLELLEREPVLDKIFCIVHPLSIMSTPELEHKAIMQIAEMLEPLCLPESEE